MAAPITIQLAPLFTSFLDVHFELRRQLVEVVDQIRRHVFRIPLLLLNRGLGIEDDRFTQRRRIATFTSRSIGGPVDRSPRDRVAYGDSKFPIAHLNLVAVKQLKRSRLKLLTIDDRAVATSQVLNRHPIILCRDLAMTPTDLAACQP